jgi:hypothetical protein
MKLILNPRLDAWITFKDSQEFLKKTIKLWDS